MKGQYEVKAGVEECERIDNGKVEYSFWADLTIEGEVREVESNCFYETEEEAAKACGDFCLQFPIAATQGQRYAIDVLDAFKISIPQRKNKPHLSVVK